MQALTTSSVQGRGVLHEPGLVLHDVQAEALLAQANTAARLAYLEEEVANYRAALAAAYAKIEVLYDEAAELRFANEEREEREAEQRYHQSQEYFDKMAPYDD